MATSRAIIQFKEQRYQVLYNDFRVYIQGVNVTAWITGSLVITRTNRDGVGTASFQLDNAMDRFVITAENLAGTWRDTTGRYSESSKHAIYLYKKGEAEVTVNRIQEMINTLFDRSLDIAKSKSSQQLKEELGNRNMPASTDAASLQQQAAIQQTVDSLPADLFTSDSERDKVFIALEEKLEAAGNPPDTAAKLAEEAVRNRSSQIKKAGNKHPKKSQIVEVNPDGSAPEGSGRHRREGNVRNPIDSDTGDARWSLNERSIVFHKNDPVRIFIHNPLVEPTKTSEEAWLYGFAGFIDAYPVTVDYITAQSTLQIQCYDLRAFMQKMRVQQNVAMPVAEPTPLFEDRSSIFSDLIVPSRYGQAFANMKFEDAMATLITGTTLEGKGAGRKNGVGDFAIGKLVTYPSSSSENPDDAPNKAILEEWHSLCLNGPTNVSDRTSIAHLTALTAADVDKIGRGTTSDGPYSPVRGLVHFLLPKDGTAARTLVQQTFDSGTEQREFVTRLEILQEFCARLDYEFTILPNGDMAFEFPMYDFLPKDFGSYENVFTLDYHLISGGFQDESGDITTAIVAVGGPELTDVNPDSNTVGSLRPIGVVQSSMMAARVGMTVEQRSLPFIRDKGRLRSFALIEFQKALANANTLDSEFGFRPFFMPNRPVLNNVEKRMGLTSSVTDTMQLFSTCSTGLGLRYIRHVRSDGSFRFITGGPSMPISYRTVFPGSRKSVGNATVGVRTSMEQDGDAGALENQDVDQSRVQPTNDDRPPSFIKEARPGTYFSLAPSARKVAEIVGQTIETQKFLLNNIPEANGRSFSIRARDPEGVRWFTDADRQSLALKAKDNGYILIDTRLRFVFEPRRPGQPDFIVRAENG